MYPSPIHIPSEEEVKHVQTRRQLKQWFRTLIQSTEYVLHLLIVGSKRVTQPRLWVRQALAAVEHYERLTQRLCRYLQSRRSDWCPKMIEMDGRLFDLVMRIRHYGGCIDRWRIQPLRTTDDFCVNYGSYQW